MPPNVLALSSRNRGIGQIHGLQGDQPVFAEAFTDRNVESRMTRQMIRPVAIEKARAVADVCRNVAACRQIDRKAGAQRVALVVIEEEEIRRRREVGQPTGYRALAFRVLVRVREIELAVLEELRRARRHLERANACALDG